MFDVNPRGDGPLVIESNEHPNKMSGIGARKLKTQNQRFYWIGLGTLRVALADMDPTLMFRLQLLCHRNPLGFVLFSNK